MNESFTSLSGIGTPDKPTNIGGLDCLRDTEAAARQEVEKLEKALLSLGMMFHVASPTPIEDVPEAPSPRLSCSALDEVSQRLQATTERVVELTAMVQSWRNRLA